MKTLDPSSIKYEFDQNGNIGNTNVTEIDSPTNSSIKDSPKDPENPVPTPPYRPSGKLITIVLAAYSPVTLISIGNSYLLEMQFN